MGFISSLYVKTLKKVVVMGGGTGTFTVLSGLKHYPVDLTAIVSMVDSGGSTGILRDELGVLPPGDVRQCLVALSASDLLVRDLMNYRFVEGSFKGHSFGNLFLSTLEKVAGNFDAAVEKASELLRVQGHVVPATLDNVSLVAYLNDGSVLRGEGVIDKAADLHNIKNIVLEPSARANKKAIKAIREADAIVIGPGDIHASLIPNLLVGGITDALAKSKAAKIYVCNLMTRQGETDGFTVRDFADVIEEYMKTPIDYVIFNNKKAPPELVKRYSLEGEHPVQHNLPTLPKKARREYIGADLINRKVPKLQAGDTLKRKLIRHNPARLAELIVGLVGKKRS
jgi:uncharacterized cofD-like protein